MKLLQLVVTAIIIQAQLWIVQLQASSHRNSTGQTLATSNFTGSSVNLTCKYRIPSFGSVFPIHWHFAKDCQEIEVNNSNTNITQTCMNSVTDPKYKCNTFREGFTQNGNLTILKLKATNDTTNGYYWCSVRNQISDQVIHIKTHSINTSTCNSSINITITSYVSPGSTSCSAEDTHCNDKTIHLDEAHDCTLQNDCTFQTRNHSPTCPPTTEKVTSTATTSSIEDLLADEKSVLEIVWVSIGVFLALLLLVVVILLTIVAALCCKKRQVNGVSSPNHHSNTYTEPGETGFVMRAQPADVGNEIKSDPEYEELPATWGTGKAVANPIYYSRENDGTPISPTSVDHENVPALILKNPPSTRAQYETISLIDRKLEYGIKMKNVSASSEEETFNDPKYSPFPFDSNIPYHISGSVPPDDKENFDNPKYYPLPFESDVPNHISGSVSQDNKLPDNSHPSKNLNSEDQGVYGSLQHSISSKTSTSSAPNSKKGVFDDPKYAPVNIFLVKPHLEVQLSGSTPHCQGEHRYSETVTIEVPSIK